MTREEQKAKIMAVRLLPPDHYANLRPVTEDEMEFQGDPLRAIEEAVVAAGLAVERSVEADGVAMVAARR